MEDKYKRRAYVITSYKSEWPERYQQLATKIEKIFTFAKHIEHVGSTSIPGMSGKNCIDVMIVLDDLTMVEATISAMEEIGLQYAGSLLGEGTRMFRMMDGHEVLANVHVFEEGNFHITEMRRLRDYMRNNSEAVHEYSQLKLSLYQEFPNDYGSYRKRKDAYVQTLMKKINETYENRTV